MKYIGAGLIEYFIQPDPVFESRKEQNKNSNYLVAQTSGDNYLFVYNKSDFNDYNIKIQIIKVKHLMNEKKVTTRNQQID